MIREKKMKKVVIFLIYVMIISFLVVGYNYYTSRIESAEQKKEAAHQYKRQNMAFGLSSDNHDDRINYHGSDEFNKSKLIIELYVYNNSDTKYYLSEEEVMDYFSNEYNENGELMVFNRSDAIENYIHWWFNGGNDEIISFGRGLQKYADSLGITEYIYEIDENEMRDLMENYVNGGGEFS